MSPFWRATLYPIYPKLCLFLANSVANKCPDRYSWVNFAAKNNGPLLTLVERYICAALWGLFTYDVRHISVL